MAKPRKESIYKNWSEVDIAIRNLGQLDIKKAALEGKMTLEINNIKEKYIQQAEEIKQVSAKLRNEIERFCEQNKEHFIKKRSKNLTYGTISYRLAESVKYTSNEENIIRSIERLNLDFVLKINKKIDKEKIKELDSGTLAKIGVSIVKKTV